MTEAARKQQIMKALETHQQSDAPERRLFPLSRGQTMLPVVKIPLSTPILNARSFRIAPRLEDHPQAGAVAADPESPEMQRIVADLVRDSHKHLADLKRSLKEEGQDEPGVITRSGVLINANTRCVLMRELLADGEIQTDSIRVAVLPPDAGPAELFDLEAVLQKKRDHKDDYDLVSELMMLRTLHEEGKMTEQQIANRQGFKRKADVVLRFRVLNLMERTRYLRQPPLPIKSFGGPKSQLQNWKELDARVQELERTQGPEAADDHLREWLILHYLGLGAVHNLRALPAGWVQRHFVEALEQSGQIGEKIAVAATSASDGVGPVDAGDADGLGLLDFGEPAQPGNDGAAVRSILDVAAAAADAESTAPLTFGDGTKHASTDVTRTLRIGAQVALNESKLRLAAGKKLDAPIKLLEKAQQALRAANEALYEVYEVPEFEFSVDRTVALLDELAEQIDEARDALDK